MACIWTLRCGMSLLCLFFLLCTASRMKEQNIVRKHLHDTVFAVRKCTYPSITWLSLPRKLSVLHCFLRPVSGLGAHALQKHSQTFSEYCDGYLQKFGRKLQVICDMYCTMCVCTNLTFVIDTIRIV